MISTVEIQRAVIGMIMLDTEIQIRHEVMVKRQFFTDENCSNAFKAITAVIQSKGTIDLITVFRKAMELKLPITAGDLSELTNRVASTQKFDEYCLILQDEFVKSEIVKRCSDILLYTTESTTSGIEIADKLQKSITDLVSLQWTNDKVRDSAELIRDAHDRYNQRLNDRINGIPPGVSTGSSKLDEYIGGWQKGHMVVIGGRPGMGKSRMMLQHFWAAAEADAAPLLFTLEMPEDDVVDVMVIAQAAARLNPRDHKNTTLTDGQVATKDAAESILSSKKYYLSSERGLSQIRAIAQRHVREKGTKAIFIDFLQKVEPSGKFMNKNAAVTEVAIGLKNLAKDLNIPIIAIASLSRGVEDRGGLKQPELQDLRESGTIESEADMVLFAWRPAYYEFNNEDTGQPYTNEFFYLHGKGRWGKAADILLYHDEYTARFYDYKEQVDPAVRELPPIQTSALNSIRSFNEVERESDPF